MDVTKIYQKLSVDEAFKHQFEIMCHYFGEYVVEKKKYKNPFRADKHGDCFFKYSKNGVLLFYDYSTAKQWFTCFDIAELRTGLSREDILDEIGHNIVHPRTSRPVELKHKISEPKPAVIKCKLCKMEEEDVKYWAQYNISEEILKLFDIRKCCKVWINEEMFAEGIPGNPIYRYKEKSKMKIYRPFAKRKEKFRNNYYGGLLEGWNQLPEKGEVVVITKSRKDVMTLYSLGIPSVGVRSETTLISGNSFNLLKSRFNKIISYMDNDRTGIEMNKKIEELFKIPYICNPENKPKDASDWMKENKSEFTEWIKEKLNEQK